MVKKENSPYLLIGEDVFSKEAKLGKLKEEFLNKDTASFNLDVLYGRELTLKELQENLLRLPLKAKKRMIVVKGAQFLKDDIRAFIIGYASSPRGHIALILDMDKYDPKDKFIAALSRLAQVYRFREDSLPPNTFTLSRQLAFGKPDTSLRTLNLLLKNGEKPERILGGLRYSLVENAGSHFEAGRRLKLLLNCDADIKTGRLKPAFALERFVINLCCFGGQPAR